MNEKTISETFNANEIVDIDQNTKIHPEIEKLTRKLILESLNSKSYSSILKSIPIEDLINEIRCRQLSETLSGHLSISPNNEVNFSIDKLTWPVGNFKIKIIFDSEIPIVEDKPSEENK